MANGLRLKMYKELEETLKRRKIIAICKYGRPANGETIKIMGKVLYKRLLVPNPWKDSGIAIHREIKEEIVEEWGGEIKKTWAGAPLTDENFDSIFETLIELADDINLERNEKIKEAIKEKEKPEEKSTKPKKKKGE